MAQVRMSGKWGGSGSPPSYWSPTRGAPYSGFVIDADPADVLALTAAGFVPIAGINSNQPALPPAQSGPSKIRPQASAVAPGTCFVDLSLSAVIASDGANWRDPISGMLV